MMLGLQRVKSLATRRFLFASCSSIASARRWSSTAPHDPLRVLFCGADQFSIFSLKALNDVRLKYPDKVASIDVVCKKDKRVGRGLKNWQEVPIKKVALEELGLRVHQIDTFTGWKPPRPDGEPINLIVAVSFGLLVPPRILDAAKYGGLNVHPSMLPDLRGPAPLHHTLLNRLKTTGVTLQTLHPKHFDQGRIVDQTPSPGLDIPSLSHASPQSLLQFVGPLGAEMLERNILTGSFAKSDEHQSMPSVAETMAHASKVMPHDREILWDTWGADELELRDRVLGRTWSRDVPFLVPGTTTQHRVTFEGWKDATKLFAELKRHHQLISFNSKVMQHDHGVPMAFKDDPEKRVFFTAGDDTIASPDHITIEGKPKTLASSFYQTGVEYGSSLPSTNATTQSEDEPPERPSNGYQTMVFLEATSDGLPSQEPAPSRPKKPAPNRPKKPAQNRPARRQFSTSATDRTSKSRSSDHNCPKIDWRNWTTSTFVSEENSVCTSDHPILHYLRYPDVLEDTPPPSPLVMKRAASLTAFACWSDAIIDYRKLIFKGNELYTPLHPDVPFSIGAPFYIMKDPKKRLFFWVWGNAEKTRIEVVTPGRVKVGDDSWMNSSEFWPKFMDDASPGKWKARLVSADELRKFHEGKKEWGGSVTQP